MQLHQCKESHVYEEQFLIINDMDQLLCIIHTIKRFFIIAFLWVFAYGLQSLATKSPAAFIWCSVLLPANLILKRPNTPVPMSQISPLSETLWEVLV